MDLHALNSCNNLTSIYFNGGCLQRNALNKGQINYFNGLRDDNFLNRYKTPAFQYL